MTSFGAAMLWVFVLALRTGFAGVPQPAGANNAEPGSEGVVDRLTALRPDDPNAYLELAEELLDRPPSPTARALVVHLLVVAFELDRLDGGSHHTAGSAAIALASLPSSRSSREWLLATAQRLDQRHAAPLWLAPPDSETEQSNGYQIALVMGFVRAGQGTMAKQVYSKPDVAASLDAFDRTMKTMGASGGADGLRREAERWPCRECDNKGVVRRTIGGSSELRRCPNCGGMPGPRLTPAEYVAQLRIESHLLSGRQRSWAAQVATDDGAPLIDPDPAALPALFRVDATRTLYRNGEWVAPATKPGQTTPDPMPKPPAKPAPEPAEEAPGTSSG